MSNEHLSKKSLPNPLKIYAGHRDLAVGMYGGGPRMGEDAAPGIRFRLAIEAEAVPESGPGEVAIEFDGPGAFESALVLLRHLLQVTSCLGDSTSKHRNLGQALEEEGHRILIQCEGAEAFREGKLIVANPYEDKADAGHWCRGWNMAHWVKFPNGEPEPGEGS